MRLKSAFMLLAIVGLSLGLSGCTPSSTPDPKKAEELTKLSGKWKFVSREGDKDEDSEEPEDTKNGYFFIVEGDILKEVYITKDGKEDVLTRRKITLSGEKNIDLVYVDEAGKPIKTRTTKKGITGKRKTTTTELKDIGLYKVEGDKLTLVLTWDTKRPTDFTAPRGSGRYTMLLEKVKDPNKKEDPKGEGTKPEGTKPEGTKPEGTKTEK